MSNKREIPVHTTKVVLELARRSSSFNQLQDRFSLSPSTLSRILKFLKANGCLSVNIVDSPSRGIRKVYNLTAKGKKLVPPMKRLDDTEAEILRTIK